MAALSQPTSKETNDFMWRNLNLRTRILLGYGLILVLAAALALFLGLRVAELNSQIKQLNDSATFEATTGARVATQIATTQRLVERYLRQPQPENLQSAQFSLQELTTAINRAHTSLSGAAQRPSRDDLDQRLASYLTAFQSLSVLISAQEPLRTTLQTHLTRSNVLLKGALAGSLSSGAAADDVAALIEVQASLQQANLWVARMAGEQSNTLGANALAELGKAGNLLNQNPGAQGSASAISVANTLNEISQATINVTQLQENLRQVQQQRDTQLDEQGKALKQQADTIAQDAIDRLTGATAALERQTTQTQQIAAAVILLTLLVAIGAGLRLAQTIARPLHELVAATSRINQGDYEVVVPQRDASETGLLAAAFNQMTAALRQQRAEMLRQQATAEQRSSQLEQALERVQAATTERETLTTTMRQLSAPVVPILDGVIVLPLIGEIDEQRAHTLLVRLLDGLKEQDARIAILDITGVSLVDTTLAAWLLKSSAAAALLGAECVLVGISPDIAEALVASGADLGRLTVRSDLRSAVEYAQRSL
jgi:anti-anti-sigma regulatory factor/HAMP domain-containing protein